MELKYVWAWAACFFIIAGGHYFLVKGIMLEKFFHLYQQGVLRMPENVNFVIIYLLTLIGFLSIMLIALGAYMQIHHLSVYWSGVSLGFFIALIQTAVWLSVNIPWSLIWTISGVEFISFSLAGFAAWVII